MKGDGGNYQFSFERLRVWQNARQLVFEVYQITEKFPSHEKFGMVEQIRRAAVSIPANIAGGSSRLSPKDQAHFSNIAYSSLMEILSHFYLAFDLRYLDEMKLNNLKLKIFEIANQLNSLRKSQMRK